MKSTSASATKVGIFVVIGIAILAALTFRIETFIEWGRYYDLIAYFNEAHGLEAKNDVTLAGSKVGFVKSVAVEDDKIKVVLSIQEDIVIRKGAKASIITDYLLGRSLANITLAPVTNPAYSAGEIIETVETPTLTDMLTDMLAKIDDALTGLQTIVEPFEDAKELMESLMNVGKALEEASPRLNELLGSAVNITKKIETGQGTVGMLITDDELYVELKKIMNDVRETMQGYREQIPVGAFGGIVFSAF